MVIAKELGIWVGLLYTWINQQAAITKVSGYEVTGYSEFAIDRSVDLAHDWPWKAIHERIKNIQLFYIEH